jgi:predicted house-cleaning noncanonical NTP pyrophosphatase (MazG superfamily)
MVYSRLPKGLYLNHARWISQIISSSGDYALIEELCSINYHLACKLRKEINLINDSPILADYGKVIRDVIEIIDFSNNIMKYILGSGLDLNSKHLD